TGPPAVARSSYRATNSPQARPHKALQSPTCRNYAWKPAPENSQQALLDVCTGTLRNNHQEILNAVVNHISQRLWMSADEPRAILLRRRNAQNLAVILVGDHVDGTVRAFGHVADAQAEALEQALLAGDAIAREGETDKRCG